MKHRISSYIHMVSIFLISLLSLRFFFLLVHHEILYYVNTRILWFIILGWILLGSATVVTAIDSIKNKTHTHTNVYTFIYSYCLIAFLIFLPVRALNPNHSLVVKQATDTEMTTEVLPTDTSSYTFSDWFKYLDSGTPQPELAGKIFNGSGFLGSYDAEQKTIDLDRLVITCCISDAYQTVVTVDTSSIATENLKSSQWYTVSGTWQQDKDDNWVVHAKSITTTNIPEDPYVFPQ